MNDGHMERCRAFNNPTCEEDMTKWQRLRIELLKDLYKLYMESHTAWADFGGDDEHTIHDIEHEFDYLVEKGWVRRSNGYQLTADGRDYVERDIVGKKSKPNIKPID